VRVFDGVMYYVTVMENDCAGNIDILIDRRTLVGLSVNITLGGDLFSQSRSADA